MTWGASLHVCMCKAASPISEECNTAQHGYMRSIMLSVMRTYAILHSSKYRCLKFAGSDAMQGTAETWDATRAVTLDVPADDLEARRSIEKCNAELSPKLNKRKCCLLLLLIANVQGWYAPIPKNVSEESQSGVTKGLIQICCRHAHLCISL